MTSSLRPRLGPLDLSETTWRGRAVRYVLIYLALTAALVTARALTQQIRPTLRAAQEHEAALLTQRNDLAVQVQSLENPQRIRDWAFANDMIRFAEAPKETQAIAPLPPPGKTAKPTSKASSGGGSLAPPAGAPDAQPQQPDNTVEVRTQWK